MPIKPIAEEQIKSGQEELRKKVFSDKSTSSYVNVKNVEDLANVRTFEFPAGSGCLYDVPSIPYTVGLRLHDWYLGIKESQIRGDVTQINLYEHTLRLMLDAMWSLSIPRGVVLRVRKKFGFVGNQFLSASEGDIAELISFFLVRRMIPNVKFLSHSAGNQKQ